MHISDFRMTHQREGKGGSRWGNTWTNRVNLLVVIKVREKKVALMNEIIIKYKLCEKI